MVFLQYFSIANRYNYEYLLMHLCNEFIIEVFFFLELGKGKKALGPLDFPNLSDIMVSYTIKSLP